MKHISKAGSGDAEKNIPVEKKNGFGVRMLGWALRNPDLHPNSTSFLGTQEEATLFSIHELDELGRL